MKIFERPKSKVSGVAEFFGIFDFDGERQFIAEQRNDARNKICEKIDTGGDGQLSADERNNSRNGVREKIREKLLDSD